MRIRSLQARSVLAAALAVLIALVVVGIGVDVLVGRHLRRSLDATLRQRAIEVAQLSASAPALVTAPGSLDSPLGGTHVTVQVLDRRGRIVARSLSLGGRVLPASALIRAAITGGRPGYANGSLGDEQLRMYAAPLANFGGAAAGGAVVVAASTQDLRSTLASLHAFLLVSGLVAATLAALALAVLMRRALRPLGRLADAAAEIERTGDPARRLPEPASADEVGRLAATLNAMLASLERARESERRFLADASHELRTPLTALRGNVDYLARHGATPELVADLEQDAERLVRLADDLLVLSREEAADPPSEEVRLDELARAVAADDDSLAVEIPGAGPRPRRPGRTRACAGEPGRERPSLRARRRRDHRCRRARGRRRAPQRPRRRARPRPGRGRARVRALLARRPSTAPARASVSRSCARPPSATAAAPTPRARGSRSSCPLSRDLSESSATTEARAPRKDRREVFRTLSTSRLLVLSRRPRRRPPEAPRIAVAASGGSGPTPPPKPLAQALHDALAAPQPDGITARITFTNKLFPSARCSATAGSALMSGATGRLWVTDDGRGRLELQSDAGDAQIVWSTTEVTVYDASSNTVYTAALPAQNEQRRRRTSGTPPTLDEITSFLTELGEARGRSRARSRSTSPASRVQRHGLAEARRRAARLGSSSPGTRRTAFRCGSAIYAQGASSPVLALDGRPTSRSAPSPTADVDVAPPAGAKVVELGSARRPSRRPTAARAGDRPRRRPGGRRLPGRRAGHARRPAAPGRPARRRRDSRARSSSTARASARSSVVERKADASAPNGQARCRACRRSRSTASPATSSRRSSAPCSTGDAAASTTSSPARCRRRRPRRRRAALK